MSDASSLPSWAERLFASELAILARSETGVPVWRIANDTSTATISDQFRANAGDYDARYAASGHFEALFTQAITHTGLEVAPSPTILDLGSGSGANSIVPCLRLFPGATAVATDLSAELLVILAANLDRLEAQDRVVCVVMDAMSNHVSREQFDLVTGAAILHHLVHPELGLEAAARALKPGGKAIFFEPFDGYGLIRLAYQRILAGSGRWTRRLDPRVKVALQAMAGDIAARTQPDRTAPGFADLDDKWLFAQERIASAAEARGFTRVAFVPHNDHETLFRDVAGVQIRLASGLDTLQLPDWAIAILDEFDAAMPMVVKRRMMLEGTIVLTKGDAPTAAPRRDADAALGA